MKTRYARVRETIQLKGCKFPAGTLVNVWDTGNTTQIQPAHASHNALWYALPVKFISKIVFLNDIECSLIDFGLL